jgi:hypothetical protein
MKFGLIKSKIEKLLTESYKKNSFKDTLFVFKELVLENKNISKLYYLYDELSSKKGLNESIASELINQSIVVYENTINKISKKNLEELNLWVGHIKSNNNYENLDNLFSTSVLTLENKIKSKKIILESLKNSPEQTETVKNLPVEKLVNVANKTLSKFINSLNEESKKTLTKILSEDENKLKLKYELLKEDVLDKLEDIKKNEADSEVLKTIDETLNRLQNENFDRISFFKLQELNRSI